MLGDHGSVRYNRVVKSRILSSNLRCYVHNSFFISMNVPLAFSILTLTLLVYSLFEVIMVPRKEYFAICSIVFPCNVSVLLFCRRFVN